MTTTEMCKMTTNQLVYGQVVSKIPSTIAAGDIAENAIDAASVKADAVTKLQAGLALEVTAGAAKTAAEAVQAKLPAGGANMHAAGAAVTLTGAYDAAKSAASQTSLDDLAASLPTLGTGARTVTITVVDADENPIESARVRMTGGGETRIGDTDESGVVVFGLDDRTWQVTITAPDKEFTPTTLAVAADVSHTYEMADSGSTIPESDPGLVTGYLYCYDEKGDAESGVSIDVTLVKVPGAGLALDTATRTLTSNAAGLVTITNLFPGGQYRLSRGSSTRVNTVTIPASAQSPYAIPNVFGYDT